MSLSASSVQELQRPIRPSELPMVDSEKTLSDFSTIQQHLIKSTNNTNESIICLEKTTTHHNFYDVEKLGDETARNSSIRSSNSYPTTTTRPFGMGNPGIIGK